MKFTSKVLLLTNLTAAAAFAPPRPHSHSSTSTQQRPFQPQHYQGLQKQSTSLPLLPDPSSLESTTILTSDLIDSLVSTVGALALLGSVGFGVFSGMKDEEWDYEYKPGNEEAKERYGNVGDLALMEVSVEEVVAAEVTEAQKSFFNKNEEAPAAVTPVKAPTPAPKPAPKPKAAVTPVKAPKKTSDAVLKATEKAKDEVKKVGVKETKEKMSSKSSSAASVDSSSTTASSTPEGTKEDTTSEVQEVKKEKGTKRKLVKGATLIVAAGAVAMARNVVKAWLGRGIL